MRQVTENIAIHAIMNKEKSKEYVLNLTNETNEIKKQLCSNHIRESRSSDAVVLSSY